MSKVFSIKEAVKLIKNGSTIAISGFVGIGFPELLSVGIEENFLETGHPNDLTLMFCAGQGDGKEKGLNHFAHEGLVTKCIGGHYGLAPKLQKLAVEGKMQAYNFPQGVLSHMFRDIAAHKPRTISTVGIKTFVDPRFEGGKVNSITTEELVDLIEFDGKEYLSYRNRPVDIALVRGTTSDLKGNVSMEREALTLEGLAIAQAVKNSGGKVIVQVERLAQNNTINARDVQIPGILVDAIVVCDNPDYHMQTFIEPYNPSFSSEIRINLDQLTPLDLTAKKIIGRRALFELTPDCVANLGIGVPEFVANVAFEENILNQITLTAEPGIIGGLPSGGGNFGAGYNVECLVKQPEQFDFYQGGGLDICFLGLAEVDGLGNLNVSRFGPKLTGCGGFIDISQNAKKAIFTGTFTTKGLETSIVDGNLVIENDGQFNKFVDKVEQITFSGEYANERGQPVLYVTERCVFELTEEGVELVEIAPGIDIEKDILGHMDFVPIIKNPKLMDPRIFSDEIMGVKKELGF